MLYLFALTIFNQEKIASIQWPNWIWNEFLSHFSSNKKLMDDDWKWKIELLFDCEFNHLCIVNRNQVIKRFVRLFRAMTQGHSVSFLKKKKRNSNCANRTEWELKRASRFITSIQHSIQLWCWISVCMSHWTNHKNKSSSNGISFSEKNE